MLASCSKVAEDLNNTTSNNSEVSFTTLINTSTRVANDAFEEGDQIAVSAFDGTSAHASNVLYSYSSSSNLFSSTSPITYKDELQELSFTAAYPATFDIFTATTFGVEQDQSSSDSYELSDLLISYCDATNDRCPKLAFGHVLSSLVINLTDSATAGGTLKIIAKGTATIDVDNKVYASTGETLEIAPLQSGDQSYKVIFAPQTIAAGELIATYEYGDTTYEWVASSDLEFLPGYRYIYEWDVDKNDVTLDGYINGWDDVTITDDDDTTAVATITLADLSSTSYPTENNWIITDSTTTYEAISESAYAAIKAIYSEDPTRQISIAFPNLEELPEYSFYSCYSLYSVSLPMATSIGEGAFYNCINLHDVYANEATTIPAYAFYCCFKIETIYAPKASTLEPIAINSCDLLTSLTLDDNYFTIEDGVVYDKDQTVVNCIMPAHTAGDLVLPSTVKAIYARAFENGLMTTISAPNVTTICDAAFSYLTNITSIELATADGVVLESVSSTVFSELYYKSTTEVDLIVGQASASFVNGNFFVIDSILYEFKSITTPAGDAFSELIINIIGDETVYVALGESYVEPGYTATENGVDISDSVVIDTELNTNSVGSWVIYYYITGSDGCTIRTARTVIVYNPDAVSIPSGTYTVQEGSYRNYDNSSISEYSQSTIEVSEVIPGMLYISDFLGGYYDQLVGYGSNYAVHGNVSVDSQGNLSLVSSYCLGWGDSLDYLENGYYDSTTGTISWDISYAGILIFHVILKI